ncbi:alpha/beta hydrolase fold-domain-containing protein [Phascolomyces articulosus]|uniref:Alpha/beta hydrolase fold-domain-containing protein n=1 Tax=Phascolomyces articulosus TaxID=60185 RepID=A0AAD5PD11_9FUNG|nr:alpha/beta hydrolase fold-domain-containing protein [Phascolomyces articulosus]
MTLPNNTSTPRVQLEPCFQEVLEREQLSPDFIRTPETQRAGYVDFSLDPQWLKRLPPAIEHQWSIPTRDGQSTITLTMNRPVGTENTILPVVVYIHGGGWVVGDATTHRRPRTELAIAAHAAVIFVSYTRSPEKKYPVALEECYDTVLWVANETNAQSIYVDPTKLVLVGDSAGGNLTVAVTLLAKQRQFNGIQGQILFYPVTDCQFDTDSYKKYGGKEYDPSRELMEWFFDQYVPDKEDREKITVCPLKATLDDLKELPPTLVLTCEVDCLLDEGEAFARKLLAAGVDVTAIRILGTIHGFLDMPFYNSRAAQAGIDHAVLMLKKIWEKTSTL